MFDLKPILSSSLKFIALGMLFSLSAPISGFASSKTHGLSSFGELKYKADFKHFDYVNPEAPKGGRLITVGTAGLTTFDSFNGYIIRGVPAQGLGYTASHLTIFDQLMVRADDEPDAVYGLVAHMAELSSDKKSVTFYMRPEAKFADGSELTAEDVIFSYETLKTKGHPAYSAALRDVVKAEKIDKYTVRYHFTGEGLRDLPLLVATLPIFSKAYYTTHEFDKISLDPPLGSGPYKIKDFQAGDFVTFKRREDYWAKDLPVNKGLYNFDELRFKCYRTREIELEDIKKGQLQLREEFTARHWATAYNIDSVKNGKLVLETLPDDRPSGTQGFFINTRLTKFKDPKIRKALGLLFDFEWSNRTLFHGLYKRTNSYFENSDLRAESKPSEAELKLLEPYRAQLQADVFSSEPYVQPITDGSGQDRKLLKQAMELFNGAGWTFENGKRINAAGEVFKIEFLLDSSSMERIVLPYIKNLQILGIEASIRTVDTAQYQERKKNFEFDIVVERFNMALTPGVGLRNIFASNIADIKGSSNLAGIKNPVVDALIEKIIQAQNRQDLITAAHALDRVLRSEHYWIPQWYKGSHNIAYWNMFSKPSIKPKYERGVIETWWYDAEKAKKFGIQ